MLVECQIVTSFSGIHGSFRRNAKVTFPYDVAQSYVKYGLVKILEIKDEPEKPTAKLVIEDEKAEEKTTPTKAKRKVYQRKAKTTTKTKK
jgi:hypothetical protein